MIILHGGSTNGQTGTTLNQSDLKGLQIFDLTTIFDKKGFTPLHMAAFHNSKKSVKILCEHVLKYGN